MNQCAFLLLRLRTYLIHVVVVVVSSSPRIDDIKYLALLEMRNDTCLRTDTPRRSSYHSECLTDRHTAAES